MAKNLWNLIRSVRETSPLVHNITNFVVMNNSANALLAVGASPIMSHAHPEVEEMVSICQSLVINIGTLDEYFVKAMELSAAKAGELNKPWVLDPVGAGATSYRNEVLGKLLTYRPTVIRGNASEILSLAKTNASVTKGVDSTAKSDEAVNAAVLLHQQFGSVVCVSGEIDIIVGPKGITYLSNGHSLMTKVTGLGCSATAVIGAFIAVTADVEEAVTAATALFSICGELAAQEPAGPGSLQVSLLDALHSIKEDTFNQMLKVSYGA